VTYEPSPGVAGRELDRPFRHDSSVLAGTSRTQTQEERGLAPERFQAILTTFGYFLLANQGPRPFVLCSAFS
jgi:hypothetical protein